MGAVVTGVGIDERVGEGLEDGEVGGGSLESVRSDAAVEVGGVLVVSEVDEERCSGDCEADIVVGEEGGETNGDEVRERRARGEGICVAVDTMRGAR